LIVTIETSLFFTKRRKEVEGNLKRTIDQIHLILLIPMSLSLIIETIQRKKLLETQKPTNSSDELTKLKKENIFLRQKLVNLEEVSDFNEIEDENIKLKEKLNKKNRELKESQHKLNISEELGQEYEGIIRELKQKINKAEAELSIKDDQIRAIRKEKAEENSEQFQKKIMKMTKEIEHQKDELINKTSKI